MATTVLAILCLALFSVDLILRSRLEKSNDLLKLEEARTFLLEKTNSRMRADWEKEKQDAFDRGRTGRIGSLDIQPGAHQVFGTEDAKIPTTPRRHVPVGIRRAQAEAASLGPKNHSEQVAANNARALDQA